MPIKSRQGHENLNPMVPFTVASRAIEAKPANHGKGRIIDMMPKQHAVEAPHKVCQLSSQGWDENTARYRTVRIGLARRRCSCSPGSNSLSRMFSSTKTSLGSSGRSTFRLRHARFPAFCWRPACEPVGPERTRHDSWLHGNNRHSHLDRNRRNWLLARGRYGSFGPMPGYREPVGSLAVSRVAGIGRRESTKWLFFPATRAPKCPSGS